jgi:uncharacterized protein (TIGR00725 family)
MQKRYIAVIGSGETQIQEIIDLAEETGSHIAQRGGILVCGGRGGVMEAACRGAKSMGGTTIGVLPGLSRDQANPFVDIAIPTGLGFSLRNTITIRTSDAVIMIHGEVGTLAEAVLSYQHGKPLVALVSSGGWAARLQQTALENGAYLDERHIMKIHYADSPEKAVETAFELIGTIQPPQKI